MVLATHVLGPFYLTHLLLNLIRGSNDPRIVFVSSGGMYAEKIDTDDFEYRKKKYDGVRAYARTKRMQVVLAELFASNSTYDGITFTSMHPGWSYTPGLSSALPAFTRWLKPFLRSVSQGIDTIVWLLSENREKLHNGVFYFDRRERKTIRLKGTENSVMEKEFFWNFCQSSTSE